MTDGTKSTKLVFLLATLVSALLTAGCPSESLKNPIEKNDLVELLRKDKWVVFNLPDSKLGVGTIIHFTEQDGLRFLGYLTDCGVPETLTKGIRGTAPQLESSNSFGIDLDLSLKIIGIPVGVGADFANSASLSVSESGADEMNIIRLQMWLADPENDLPEVCKSFFEEGGDNAVISSAFRVTSGVIDYKRTGGGHAGLSDIDIAKIADLEAKGNVTSVSEGKVTFDGSDYYIAFKRILPLSGGLKFLGEGGEDAASMAIDEKIQAWADRN